MNILQLYRGQRPRTWQISVESLAQSFSLLLLLGLGLASPPPTSDLLFSLSFLPAIWIAWRQGLPGALAATLAVNGSILASVFWLNSPPARPPELLTAWLVLSLTVVVMGQVISLNRRTTARLVDQPRHTRTLDALPVENLSEQKRIEQQLADALELNQKILIEAPIGILVYNSLGDCIAANASAARIVGGTQQQLMQQNFRHIDSWRQYGLLTMAEQALAGEPVRHSDLHFITTFGKDVWLGCCAAALSVNGEAHLLVLLDDVSERKRVEQELACHQTHLEEMVQERAAALQTAYLVLQQEMAERQRAVQDLQVSERQFRQLADTMPQLVWTAAADGRVDYVNTLWQLLSGIAVQPDGQWQWEAVLHPDDSQRTLDAWQHALATGEGYELEHRLRRADGCFDWYLTRVVPVRDEAGAVIRWYGASTDIHAQKEAEEQLQYQATLLHDVSDAIIGTDLDFHITAWNPAAEALYGWPAEEVMGRISTQVVQSALTPEELEKTVQQLWSEGVWRGEITHHHQDGRPLQVLVSVSLVRDSRGQPMGIVAVNRDLTGRKEAEAQLRILSRSVEQSPTSIIVTDVTGRIDYVNPRFVELTGYTLAEAVGQNPRILKSGHTSPAEYARLWQTITTGGEWRGEFRNKNKAGELYWESTSISPILDEHGVITHFVALKEDITTRKQQEQEREALLRVATALRTAEDHHQIVSIILEQVSTSLGGAQACFVSSDPATGERVLEAIYAFGKPQDYPIVRFSPEQSISDQVYRTGRTNVSGNVLADPQSSGYEFIEEEKPTVCIPLLAQHDTSVGVLWVGRPAPFSSEELRLLGAIADMAANALQRADLHEQVVHHAAHLEEQVAARTRELATANERLQELDRLKSKFVSNVTHELRTPVTNLGLYLKLLGRKPQKQEQYMMVLREQAERLRTLVNDVLELSQLDQQRDAYKRILVDLNELVQSVVAAHEPRAEALNLALIFEPAPDLPLVQGDRDKLVQVMTNLVANALNYTPAGRVVVRTYWNTDRRTVCSEVEDTGCGIQAEDLPHLFDRFYRGKRDRMRPVPGTGLGLSIVKELVELHGGAITVASEVGIGSTFTVCLPVP